MSNSNLINYTKISPNKNVNRKHKIDTITIHCVVGQLSVETLGNVFSNPNRPASCNYGIGTDGRIGMYVEEKDRSWCSSSASNDNRAITIECASDRTHPYTINRKVYMSLISLCTDICERNGIVELKWKNDKSLIGNVKEQNMTVHRWFSNKACPGEYIFNKLGQIANDVNFRLNNGGNPKPNNVDTPSKPNVENITDIAKEVIGGEWGNGEHRTKKLIAAGYDPKAVQLEVNKILNGSKPDNVKSIEEVAKEVLNGKWGNGHERRKRLEAAGYSYGDVQAAVNKLL